MLTVKVSLLLLLLLAAVIVFVAGVPQRSARWDAFLNQPRHERSAGSWQGGGRDATCTLTGLTADDTLGRRTSGLLSSPQSQGKCGSCWAFAAAHTYTDHLSVIAGRRTSQLSAQYLTACARSTALVINGNGCCGGYYLAGFNFFQRYGAVTDTCAPYTLYDYSTDESFKSRNPIRNFCPTSCRDGTPFQPSNLRFQSRYRIIQEESRVITALRTGTLLAAMSTSYRFKYDYRCGVFGYDPRTDKLTGRHAVEIVDYGTTTSGINFWVLKNSWGSRWGENGYFRIRRGDPLLDLTFSTPVSSLAYVMTCAAETVSNPSQDTLVMSAVDVAIMQLNGRIPCRDNSAATYISLASVTNANAQNIQGTMLKFNIVVNVHGCMQTTQASVNVAMISYLNSTFELTDHTYRYLDNQSGGGSNEPDGATAITGNIFLLAATIMVVLTFGCY